MSDNKFFDTCEFDFEAEKTNLLNNMNFLKNMTVEESTFYKKWYEMRGYKKFISNSSLTKAKIWNPSDIMNEQSTIEEITKINPTVIYVETKQQELDWLMLRVFSHTMEFSQSPGRFVKLLISDGNENDPKYLGAVSLSSDVISITDRDNYLGWNEENKLKHKRINNSTIGSCIMATQPFGYNFLGGKLVAALITTKYVRDIWEKLYDNKLVGMTTTSLYGTYSMYNSLKWWHKCGESSGKISIKPDDDIYNKWHHWIQKNKPEEYEKMMQQKEGVSGPVTAAKQRVLNFIFRELKIKASDYNHGFNRGTYYSCFYENTREFLCEKVAEKDLKLKPLFEGDKNSVLSWWKDKAINRYKKLLIEGNVKPDILFYNEMVNMTYSQAKNKYFKEVGR